MATKGFLHFNRNVLASCAPTKTQAQLMALVVAVDKSFWGAHYMAYGCIEFEIKQKQAIENYIHKLRCNVF